MKNILILLLLLSITPLSVAQTNEVQSAMDSFRYKEALTLLEKEPETLENLKLKASVYEKLYNYPAALSIYNQLIEQHPNDVNLAIAMAECASQAGKTQQSLRGWISADSISPNNLFIQTKKAMAYYRNSNWTETIEASKSVFRTDSVSLLLRMVGDAYLNKDDADSAIWFYAKAIEKNPADYVAVSKLGNVYYAAKFYEAAINITGKYLTEIDSNQTVIGQLNGMAYYSNGQFDEAIERLSANVELGDSTYTTTYFLGMSNYGKAWYYEAAKWLGKAYDQNPSDPSLLYYYGTALGRVKKREQAVGILQEGIDKINQMSEMLFGFDVSMAEAYENTNAHAKAIEYYSSAYKRKPDQHNILYNIARAYDAMKDYKNAIVAYERYLKTAPQEMDIAALALSEEKKLNLKTYFYISSYNRIKELQEKMFMQSGK